MLFQMEKNGQPFANSYSLIELSIWLKIDSNHWSLKLKRTLIVRTLNKMQLSKDLSLNMEPLYQAPKISKYMENQQNYRKSRTIRTLFKVK